MLFENIHQTAVQDKTVFYGLRPSLGQLALPQGGEGFDVGEHPSGLIERPHQVLGLGQIDRHLAADGGVHHRRHAGRHLYERNASQECRGHEPTEIPNDPSPDADDRLSPLRAQLHEPVVNGLGQLEALAGLTSWNDETVSGDTALLQGPLHVPAVGVHHVFVGDDIGGAFDPHLQQTIAEAVDDPPSRYHGIGAAGVVDFRSHVWVGHCYAISMNPGNL